MESICRSDTCSTLSPWTSCAPSLLRRRKEAFPALDGVGRIGVFGSMPVVPEGLDTEKLLDVSMTTVVAASHPLAARKELLRARDLEKHVKLVLTDRSNLSAGSSYGVFSPLIWR